MNIDDYLGDIIIEDGKRYIVTGIDEEGIITNEVMSGKEKKFYFDKEIDDMEL